MFCRESHVHNSIIYTLYNYSLITFLLQTCNTPSYVNLVNIDDTIFMLILRLHTCTFSHQLRIQKQLWENGFLCSHHKRIPQDHFFYFFSYKVHLHSIYTVVVKEASYKKCHDNVLANFIFRTSHFLNKTILRKSKKMATH